MWYYSYCEVETEGVLNVILSVVEQLLQTPEVETQDCHNSEDKTLKPQNTERRQGSCSVE